MNVLIVGNAAGSFQIRGHQLGNAIGARVTSAPSRADWEWADLCVLVKRAGPKFAAEAHRVGVPIVWDALDFWQQPNENGLSEEAARGLLQAHLDVIKPVLTIGATQAQAEACGGIYLPHHSWRGLEPIQAREGALVVAYQGNLAYMGKWADAVGKACGKRGWRCVLNPDDLWTADIIVAFRDGPWDGWMCRQWKSGVKVVNAIAAGRPVITQASAAVAELAPPGSVIAEIAELDGALDTWVDLTARRDVVNACRSIAPALRLPAIADRYRTILVEQVHRCAA